MSAVMSAENERSISFWNGDDIMAIPINIIDLLHATGISKNTLSKFSKNKFVSMDVLVKLCRVLECDIGDIIEILPENNNEL